MIRGPNVLVVHPSVPVDSVPEFVRHLKQDPGKLSYGTPGLGQSPHLSGVWFHQLTETQGVPVHYRGAAPAMVALVGGDIQYMFDNFTTAIEQVRAGRVKALAVTSADRNPQLPELPALRETMPGLADYDVSTWFGVFYPAAVPEGAVRALNAELKALLARAGTRQRFAELLRRACLRHAGAVRRLRASGDRQMARRHPQGGPATRSRLMPGGVLAGCGLAGDLTRLSGHRNRHRRPAGRHEPGWSAWSWARR